MESAQFPDPNRLARIINSLRSLVRDMVGYAKQGDPNLGEGKLRGSVMPERYMDIPDFPPDDYKNTPPTEG